VAGIGISSPAGGRGIRGPGRCPRGT
jgi:hypothetical protein